MRVYSFRTCYVFILQNFSCHFGRVVFFVRFHSDKCAAGLCCWFLLVESMWRTIISKSYPLVNRGTSASSTHGRYLKPIANLLFSRTSIMRRSTHAMLLLFVSPFFSLNSLLFFVFLFGIFISCVPLDRFHSWKREHSVAQCARDWHKILNDIRFDSLEKCIEITCTHRIVSNVDTHTLDGRYHRQRTKTNTHKLNPRRWRRVTARERKKHTSQIPL